MEEVKEKQENPKPMENKEEKTLEMKKPEIKPAAKEEKKPETKKLETKEAKETKPKFVEGNAMVNSRDLAISTKHAIAICDFIRYKNPDDAIDLLERVLNKELAVPMKGEIPHRKRGLLPQGKVAGRFPIKASKVFIKLIRSLVANANVKGLDVENLRISLAKADKAARGHKPTRMAYGRKRFKRSHVTLEAKTMTKTIAKEGIKKGVEKK